MSIEDVENIIRLAAQEAHQKQERTEWQMKGNGHDPALSDVEIINGGSITPVPVSWQWNGWLAEGKVHLLAGAKGTMKTTIAIDLAAAITTGRRWPDGTQAPLGDVLIWSGEDDFADTLLPRLLAAGGDCNRFHYIKGISENGKRRPFDPARDMSSLSRQSRNQRGGSMVRRYQSCREPDDGIAHGAL